MLLEFILAIIPIAWLIIAMTALHMSGFNACGIGLIITIVECLAFYGMSAPYVAFGTIQGILSAIWPIGIIIFAAMFTYNMSLHTHSMDVIKGMLASVSNDKRVVALLLGWGFSNFMEGIAGFGTAVAIPAAMMIGLGFNPISAAVICLIGNAASPAFGAIATPTLSAASAAGLDANLLATPTIILLGGLCVLAPIVMVILTGGSTKALKGMVPMIVVSIVSFYLPFLAVGHFVGPELACTIGAIVSLVAIILLARGHQDIPEEYLLEKKGEAAAPKHEMNMIVAWLPYILIVIFLLGASKLCPPINQALGAIKSSFTLYTVADGTAVSLSFSWINTPGVLIFIAAVIGSLVQKASVGDLVSILGKTVKQYWKAVATVCFIISIAKLMGYAGMVTDLANVLVTVTGGFYPFIAPIIGGIGCFVTGSATSACVMFADMQNQVALQLGLDPYWLVAANSAGATAGKMISPQSIAVAVASVGLSGKDSEVMSGTIKWCVLFLLVVCVMSYAGVLLGLA